MQKFNRKHKIHTIKNMQRNVKTILSILYVVLILCMGVATLIENSKGTEFVKVNIYGAWWFVSIWVLAAIAATVYFVKARRHTVSSYILHASFVVILLGAFATHLTSTQGMIHVREGETTKTYYVQGKDGKAELQNLPFSVRLDKFGITYHEGTESAADYTSWFTLTHNGRHYKGKVAMNKIFRYQSFRLYQASYDEDGHGASLAVNADPYGIALTYTGYALLFLSLLWVLVDPNGAYRKLLKHPLLQKGALTVAFMFSLLPAANAAPTLPKETAERFGQLSILYNGRICPVQTFALDFTKKMYGARTYNGLTAEQVLTGWIFWGEEWSNEPFIKIKNGALRNTLQLPAYTSLNAFFNPAMGGYTLGPYVQEFYQGQQDKFHKEVADVDDRLQLLMELRHGTVLKIFPHTYKGKTTWYSPTDKLPNTIDVEHAQYMQNVFTLLYEYAMSGDTQKIEDTVGKMIKYQTDNGGQSLQSEKQVSAERIYNKIPFATILFMLNLSMGFLSFLLSIRRMIRKSDRNAITGATQTLRERIADKLTFTVMLLSFAALTYCEALRWTISGTIPMANGYETMLFVAWLVMLLSLVTCRRFRIMLTCGFLMSGFFLLVSHIGQMDPQITHRMPVLNSPLLSVHVSIIMIGFALLSLTFICSLTALVVRMVRRSTGEQIQALQLLSQVFLFPALAALGIGIFIGAIWANVSWGEYWGWDPKEVWALITFMVYAVAVHTTMVPAMRRPVFYHVFMVLAFLTILMTYFGVNYFLGGMHSYA